MSYQVLARKWRPKSFREMVGQEHVLKALINALDHNRLHHAYLFTGTRGVGKTTIARILAKCLNCEVGVSSEPCGECSACVSINEGRFVDLIEVDAASRTKVEDTRELLENVQYAPTNGRYKVYLIDEVHMLSTHSFNALLKTLEEPPPHVKFLLATTDPQKLPATILSRCLQFNLKNMSPERIVDHLKSVLDQEMVNFEESALWLLGRAADGSMRDAMSLTDQAIAFGSGKLVEADVRNMLGSIDQSAVYNIICALVAADGQSMLQRVQQLSEHAPDYAAVLEELLNLLHRIAIAQAVPEAVDNSQGDKEQVTQLAAQLPAEDVQLFYQIALNGRRDLPLAPDPRSGFEMVLLRMLAFKPEGVIELPRGQLINSAQVEPAGQQQASAAPVGAEEAPVQVKKLEASGAAPAQVVASSTVKSVEEVGKEQVEQRQETKEEQREEAKQQSAAAISQLKQNIEAEIEAEVAPEVSPINDSPLQLKSESKQNSLEESISLNEMDTQKGTPALADVNPENWSAIFPRLNFGGVVGSIASRTVLERIEGDIWHMALDQDHATLFNDSYRDRIAEHLTVTLNSPVQVKMIVKAISVETPAALKNRKQQEKLEQAVETVQNDPNVQVLINEFDAVVDTASIKPL